MERGSQLASRVEGKAVDKTSIKHFVKLIRAAKPRYLFFVIGILAGIVGTLIQLQVPKMVQPLVNSFSHGVNGGKVAIVIALYIVSAAVSAIAAIVLGIFGESVVKNLRTRVWDKMIHLPVKYFDEVKTGEMSSRLANDTTQVKNLIANAIPQAFTSILLLVGSIVFMLQMQWRLTLAMIIAVPIVMLIMFPIMTFGQKIGRTRQDSLANFQGIASESLSEIRLVKSSNAEKQASKKAENDVNALYKIGVKEAVFDGLMSPVMMLSMMLMIFGLLAYGIYLISTGVMSLGTLLGMMMYLMNLIGAVPTVATFFTELAKASGSTARLTELLEEEQEVLHQGERLDNDIIQNNLKDTGSHQFKAYVGEPEYVDELKKRLPHNFEINLQDRTLIPITATEIREHPLKHWNSINRIFRRHFTKKVLVAGSASTGKSTLVKRLARTFNAPFSEEYARLYEEQNNVTDAELKASDYAEFIMGQWNANYKEVISPSNNGLTIFDTDVMVTRAYAQLYLSPKDNQELESIFNLFINKQDFDLIFIIPPITEYVNDGFRNMDWEATKMDYHQTLLQIIKKYGFKNKVVILDDRGNDKYEGFYLRYLHAVSEVNQLLK